MPKEQDTEPVIWTDNENTRSLIWRAYWGFVEHLDNYLMYKNQFGRINRINKAGVYKHAVSFYYETIDLIERLKQKKIEYKEDVDEMIVNNTIFDSDENLFKLRRFISSFMYVSGIKKIVYDRDKRDNMKKVEEQYGV